MSKSQPPRWRLWADFLRLLCSLCRLRGGALHCKGQVSRHGHHDQVQENIAFFIILAKQPSHAKVRETIAFLRCSEQTTISFSSLWLGLLGGDWFYLSCNDPIFILIGLIKLVVSFIGALLMCYMSDWYDYMPLQQLKAQFHFFFRYCNIASLPFSGSTSALEARWSTLVPSLALFVSSFLQIP